MAELNQDADPVTPSEDAAPPVEAQLPGGASRDAEPEGAEQEYTEQELEQLRKRAAERDEYLELLQRVRADYANYQKRVQKQRESERRYAAMPLAADLLPVMDNLERAIAAAGSEDNSAGLLDGIRMVYQECLDVLGRHGVQPIVAEGRPFDPNVHEAMLEEPSADKPPRTVLRELQRGYLLHDRVIRPTKVVVSTAPSPKGQKKSTDDSG